MQLDVKATSEKAIVELEPLAQKNVVAPPRPPLLSKPSFRRPEATKAVNARPAEAEDEENVPPGPAKPALPPSRKQTLHNVSSPSPMPPGRQPQRLVQCRVWTMHELSQFHAWQLLLLCCRACAIYTVRSTGKGKIAPRSSQCFRLLLQCQAQQSEE